MKVNYSFVIPHKNSPQLLKRCMDSIPERSDIQIIIVDDNSDDEKKPLVGRENVELILLNKEQSQGAGHARNVGMRQAKGEWLLFADADDYYTPQVFNVLDSYLDSGADVVYFNFDYVDSLSLKQIKKNSELRHVDNYDGTKDSLDKIKYLLHAPWGKMINRSFTNKFGIQFESIPKGNDTFFSFQVAYFSQDVKIDKRICYVHTHNLQSITNKKWNLSIYKVTFQNRYKVNSFLSFVGHPSWKVSIVKLFGSAFRRERFTLGLKIVMMFCKEYKDIVSVSDLYVNSVKAYK